MFGNKRNSFLKTWHDLFISYVNELLAATKDKPRIVMGEPGENQRQVFHLYLQSGMTLKIYLHGVNESNYLDYGKIIVKPPKEFFEVVGNFPDGINEMMRDPQLTAKSRAEKLVSSLISYSFITENMMTGAQGIASTRKRVDDILRDDTVTEAMGSLWANVNTLIWVGVAIVAPQIALLLVPAAYLATFIENQADIKELHAQIDKKLEPLKSGIKDLLIKHDLPDTWDVAKPFVKDDTIQINMSYAGLLFMYINMEYTVGVSRGYARLGRVTYRLYDTDGLPSDHKALVDGPSQLSVLKAMDKFMTENHDLMKKHGANPMDKKLSG